MYYVYIIESISNKKYYTGCTNNLKRRLKEHDNGLSRYTKTGRPWILKYKECFNILSEARKRESQIKAWKKRSAIEKLISAAIV